MFWSNFLNWIEKISNWSFVIICILALIAVNILIAWKIKNRIFSIILASASSILITVPLISSLNILIETEAKTLIISESKDELKNLKLQVENEKLKKQTLEKDNEIAEEKLKNTTLQAEIDLLSHTQLNLNTMNKILKVALMESKMKSNDVRIEDLSKEEDWYGDSKIKRIIYVATEDVDIAYGFDFNKLRVYESDGKLCVSKIKTEPIGKPSATAETKFVEVIESVYDKKDLKKKKSQEIIFNDANTEKLKAEKAQQFHNEFQKRVANANLNGLEDATSKLGENFIRTMLSPINSNIEFVTMNEKEGVTISDYISNQIEERKDKMKKN